MNVTIPFVLVFAIAMVALGQQQSKAATVIQQPVNTGNSNLNKQIENFYKCVSNTHKDPPSIAKTDACFFSNVSSGLKHGLIFSSNHIHTRIIESFNFGLHHFHFHNFHHGLRNLVIIH